jgi:HEAT repeat protein
MIEPCGQIQFAAHFNGYLMTKWHVFAAFLIAALVLIGANWFGLFIRINGEADRPWFYSDVHDPDAAVRVETIRRMSSDDDESGLLEGLNDENVDVRLLAASGLSYTLRNPDKRMRALIPLLNDVHPGVRREAAKTLSDFHFDPPLLAALDDDRPRVRAGALQAILFSQYGRYEKKFHSLERLRSSIPKLQKLADADSDAEVRERAQEIIKLALSKDGQGQ